MKAGDKMEMDYIKMFEYMKQNEFTVKDLREKAKLSYEEIYMLLTGEAITEQSAQKIYNAFDCQFKDIFDSNIELRSVNNAHSKKTAIGMYTMDGKEIARFDGIREAARTIGRESSAIVQCVNEKRKSAYGFVWRKTGEVIK